MDAAYLETAEGQWRADNEQTIVSTRPLTLQSFGALFANPSLVCQIHRTTLNRHARHATKGGCIDRTHL